MRGDDLMYTITKERVIPGAIWTDNNEDGPWFLISTGSRNKRVLAEVQPGGAWQTFDMDGAGGESGEERFNVPGAKREAEESLKSMGYL